MSSRRPYIYKAVWQEAYGPIPVGCVIHHVNGDPTDDRLENLQCMTRSAHSLVHVPELDYEAYRKLRALRWLSHYGPHRDRDTAHRMAQDVISQLRAAKKRIKRAAVPA